MFPRVSLLLVYLFALHFEFSGCFPSDLRPQLQKQFCKTDKSKKNPQASLEKLFESWEYWLLRFEGMTVVLPVFTENLQIEEQLLTLLLSSSPKYSALLFLSCYFTASDHFEIQSFWVWGSRWFSPVYLKNHMLNWGIYSTWQGLRWVFT